MLCIEHYPSPSLSSERAFQIRLPPCASLLRVFLQLLSSTVLHKQGIRSCFKIIAPAKFVNLSVMGGMFSRKLRLMISFD